MKRFEVHSHTDESNIRNIDSINKIDKLIDKAKKNGLCGIAITDHESLGIHMKANKLMKKEEDFKIALGNEIYLVDNRGNGQKYYHFILIAKDKEGYEQLRKLSTNAWYFSYKDRGERVPTLKSELEYVIKQNPGHIIATTACLGGELSTLTQIMCDAEDAFDTTTAKLCHSKIVDFILWNKDLFGDDFYIECAPGCSKEQILVNNRLLAISNAFNVKMVIGTDAHYLSKEDRFVHASYLNSKDAERETASFYEYSYLQTEDEIQEHLNHSSLGEYYEQMVLNSFEIYNKIENYDLSHTQKIPVAPIKEYPVVDKKIPDSCPIYKSLFTSDNIQERFWANETYQGMLEKGILNNQSLKRLETEANIIKIISETLNVCLYAYFNTFKYYIDLFWEKGSIVGPGRGSATGFLSNYCLGITQVNPVRWNLAHWRFLNEARIELPDIDIDLAPSKRKAIFKAIREQRGELGLVQVSTRGTEGTKSAVLTACRGYRSKEYPDGIDVDEAQYLSSLIPQERGFLWSLNDVVYGNEEKDRKPVKTFIEEISRFPRLLEIAMGIEGLINKRSEHASGVILYDEHPFETAAFMRTPSGSLVTQYDLHDAEEAGDIKYDFLLTEISDKLIKCCELLEEDNVIPQDNLRNTYNKILHPEVINTEDKRIWEHLEKGDVLDVFQFNSGSGLAIAKKVKPQNPMEMTIANALMRLMSEKGKESLQDRYVRIKSKGLAEFEREMQLKGVSPKHRALMHGYCDDYYGCVPTQELMMRMLMEKDFTAFDLKEANAARKIVAKKKMNEIPVLREDVFSRFSDENFAEYFWDTVIRPQLGYAFSENHSLPYSFVGIQSLLLATNYNPIYWNTACLIVNSGSLSDENNESTDYTKQAKAIGDIRAAGIKMSLADVNKSDFGFKPDAENNMILFGLKGANKVGTDVVNEIIENRPYTSFYDFLNKTNIAKQAMISLIKGGAFDGFGDRKKIMGIYLWSVCDKKNKLTLQNFNGLIKNNLIPLELSTVRSIFEFNRYLKACCKINSVEFELDERALKFYTNNYGYDKLNYKNQNVYLNMKDWDNTYQREMDVAREWLKDNQDSLLKALNLKIFKEDWDKYATGSISAWEMESLCFYYHDHELKNLDNEKYGISNFFDLSEEPEVEYFWNRGNASIPIYKIHTIAGTCIAKDKTKSCITLLTTEGVVNVKFRKEYFSLFDKQISEKQIDGTKKVMEKSWFNRGALLMIKGIRRGDDFVVKKYSKTPGHQLYKITNLNEETGEIEIISSRYGMEDNNE